MLLHKSPCYTLHRSQLTGIKMIFIKLPSRERTERHDYSDCDEVQTSDCNYLNQRVFYKLWIGVMRDARARVCMCVAPRDHTVATVPQTVYWTSG